MRVILWILVICPALYGSISYAYRTNYSALTAFGDWFVYFPIYAIAFFVYLIPSYLSLYRCHKNHIAISTLNVLLGWSVIGWIGSLVWALTSNTLETKKDELTILGKRLIGFFVLCLGMPIIGSGLNRMGGPAHALRQYEVATGLEHGIYFSPWLQIAPGALMVVAALIILDRSNFFNTIKFSHNKDSGTSGFSKFYSESIAIYVRNLTFSKGEGVIHLLKKMAIGLIAGHIIGKNIGFLVYRYLRHNNLHWDYYGTVGISYTISLIIILLLATINCKASDAKKRIIIPTIVVVLVGSITRWYIWGDEFEFSQLLSMYWQ